MNKKVFGRKLSRSRPAREALFSSLVRGMVLNGKMVTTEAKAKAIRGDLEHMVYLAKKADINSRRTALSYLDNAKEITDLLFNQISKFFANRTSGFTKVINLPRRKGDNAKMVRIEWTEKVVVSNKPVAISKTINKEKTVKTKETAKKIKSKTNH